MIIDLKMAWNENVKQLILEVDSMVVIQLLAKEVDWSNLNTGLINHCRELLCRNWEVQIQHVFREGNAVADGLANKGLDLNLGAHYFDALPLGISALVFSGY